jgi:hypothetical protein
MHRQTRDQIFKLDPTRSTVAREAWDRKGGVHDSFKVNHKRDRQTARKEIQNYA